MCERLDGVWRVEGGRVVKTKLDLEATPEPARLAVLVPSCKQIWR